MCAQHVSGVFPLIIISFALLSTNWAKTKVSHLSPDIIDLLVNYDSNNSTKKYNSFTILLLDVCVWRNMFRGSPRPSSGAYNCTRSLWFYRWRAVAGVLLVVFCQTTTNNAPAAAL
jgi:hypothetical protein